MNREDTSIVAGLMSIVLIGAVMFFIGYASALDKIENSLIPCDTVYVNDTIYINENQCVDEDLLMNMLIEQRVKHPKIVMAQAIIESGTFTSNVYRNSNNLFGMKLPRQRTTTAIGSYNGYAKYKGWQNSVHDYAIYQSLYYKGLGKDAYLNKLSESYAEDPGYIGKIKKLIKTFE